LNKKLEILLGDNPFFGIDHLSQERARQRMESLKGFDEITKKIEAVTELGVKGFVVSIHPQLRELITHIESKTNLIEELSFYPIIPYAQGYVSKVTEKGIVGALNDVLSSATTTEKLKIFFKGSVGFLKKDFDKLFQTLIDIELLPFKNTKTRIIFLHDVLTDLAISLKMKDFMKTYLNHIRDNYKTDVGVVTKNFPKLVKTFSEWEMDLPVIMTNFNPIGYQMNPSKDECENNLQDLNTKIIAMNTLAGGYISPEISARYISKLNLESVVIGMSNQQHAKESILAFSKKYDD